MTPPTFNREIKKKFFLISINLVDLIKNSEFIILKNYFNRIYVYKFRKNNKVS